MAKSIPRISIVIPSGGSTEVRQSDPHSISANDGVYQGLLCMIKVVTPTYLTSRTTIIKLYDRNGILLYTSAALAETSGATGYALAVDIPLTHGEYITATPSGAIGAADRTVTIDMDYIPDHFMEVY